jgi:hypothetical protein
MLKEYEVNQTGLRGGVNPSVLQKGIALVTTVASLGLGIAGVARALEGNPEALALLFGASVTFVSGLLGMRAVDVEEIRQQVHAPPAAGPPMPFPPPIIDNLTGTVTLAEGTASALQTEIIDNAYIGRLDGDEALGDDRWYMLEDLEGMWRSGQWFNPVTRAPITGVSWSIARFYNRDRTDSTTAQDGPRSLDPEIQVVVGSGKTHRTRVLKKFKLADRGYTLPELARVTGNRLSVLQQVYNRGIGAYKTQPSSVRMKGTFKKGVNAPMSQKLSKEQWALSRVYSFIDGNPKHDTDLRRRD